MGPGAVGGANSPDNGLEEDSTGVVAVGLGGPLKRPESAVGWFDEELAVGLKRLGKV